MREFVLPDLSLASRAGQFVWLEINTEDERNAAFLEKFPVDALPTFQVLDPKEEAVALRWVGSLTVAQLHAFLDNGRIAVAGAGGSIAAADRELARADRLYGQARFAEAAAAYRAALGSAPEKWPSYARTVESLLFSYQMTDAGETGVGLARAALPRLAGTPSELGVAVGGLDCALELKPDHSDRARLVALFEAEVRRLVANPHPDVAADDVSGSYGVLVEARRDANDEAGARKTAEQWAAYLEAAAARAKTPAQRTVFDAHRLSAYLELKQPERAIPMLEASQRDFPGDYNPPARLALAYKELKRWDEALAASDRALELAYGPRKLRVYETRAEIQAGQGDTASARRTLDRAIAYAEKLPKGQRSERRIAGLRKKLEGLTPATQPAPASGS